MTDSVDITKYGNKSYVRAAVGTQFDDMPDYVDYLERAGEPIPDTAAERGTHKPTNLPLAYKYYFEPQYVGEEVEKIWKKTWQVACRVEDIPNVGDRVAYDVGPLSFLVVRSSENTFKAFWNSCRHRARRLCTDEPESGDMIQCPFHAWSYDLDGKLQWIPREEDFVGIQKSAAGLRSVQCEVWGGNVFINPDPAAAPLAKTLGVMPSHFLDCPQEDRYTAVRIKKKVHINWKSGLEAFLEGYHVLTTHPSGMPIFGSTHTQTDCWDDGVSSVSRLITPALVPDGWVRDEVTPRLALELFCNTYDLPPPPAGRGDTVADARNCGSEMLVERYLSLGVDFRDRSNSYLIDMHQWFSFPAFFPWWGEGLPWWYNFVPIGEDPNSCIMEVRVLLPKPADGSPPPPLPKTVWIDFDEQGKNFPETAQAGRLLDEDMENMIEVQKGMKAADPQVARPILSANHEARVRHFQGTYMRVMGIPS